MNIKRNCDICGAEYWAQNAKSKYCSDDCKRVAYKERQRKFNEAHPGYHAEKSREWKENNPERFRELQQKRNASEEFKESRRNEWRSKHELVERVFECPVCGKPVATWRDDKKFCSSDCRSKYVNSKRREKSGFDCVCIKCGDNFRTKYSPKSVCHSCLKKEAEERIGEIIRASEAKQAAIEVMIAERKKSMIANCKECGISFVKEYKTQLYCSDACKKESNKKHKTRSKHKNRVQPDKYIDKDITVKRLFERDDGVCYLCGRYCDFDDYEVVCGTVVCGNDYPSIDHVIPVSLGGEHSWNNVRLAHRLCNSIKRNNLL